MCEAESRSRSRTSDLFLHSLSFPGEYPRRSLAPAPLPLDLLPQPEQLPPAPLQLLLPGSHLLLQLLHLGLSLPLPSHPRLGSVLRMSAL